MMMSNGMRANPRPVTFATLALSFDGGGLLATMISNDCNVRTLGVAYDDDDADDT